MRFRIYKAKDGFRWQCLSRNKRIIAESGEAYVKAAGARKALKRFIGLVITSQDIVVVDESK